MPPESDDLRDVGWLVRERSHSNFTPFGLLWHWLSVCRIKGADPWRSLPVSWYVYAVKVQPSIERTIYIEAIHGVEPSIHTEVL